MLVLDSGGVSRLAARTTRSLAHLRSLREAQLWPPIVLTPVLVECLFGHPRQDANVNRFLKTSVIEGTVSEQLARRAARLHRLAGRGSAVDAMVVAAAEPGGTVLTGDRADIEALAAHAKGVGVEPV